MSQAVTAFKIGSRVRVDLEQVRDRIPGALKELLEQNSRGTIIDYKMTDGGDIGVVLELSDGKTSWFFGNEVVRA